MKFMGGGQVRKRQGAFHETVVDITSLRDNPAYFWLALTVVSFVLAGLREELWRSAFVAGLRTLWRRHVNATGQIYVSLLI